jgi:hypothetical protein
MVAEISIGVLYYFHITPRTTTASWESSPIPMSSYMPTMVLSNVYEHEFGFSYVDGSYSLVNIVASTDSLFADVFYSDSLDASSKTITGMTAGTNYYVKITLTERGSSVQ